LHTALD